MSPQVHTNFIPVKIHTAKCDSCDKNNKLTLYRCIDCGLHVCSICFGKKSGDRNHAFDDPSRNVFADSRDNTDKSEGARDNKNRTRTRNRRRLQVVSDDSDDDNNVLVLNSVVTTNNQETTDPKKQDTTGTNIIMNNEHREDHTSKKQDTTRTNIIMNDDHREDHTPNNQDKKRKNIIMNNDHGEDHTPNEQRKKRNKVNMNDNHPGDQADGLPRLQPTVPAKNLPVLRPAIPAANTSATESAHRVSQRSSHTHGQESQNEGQDIMQVYDNLGRQTVATRYAFDGDQQVNLQARGPSKSSISHQQANRSAHPHTQPVDYRPRPNPRADVDLQAARNQSAFANSPPTGHQAPRPAQLSMAQQQAPHPIQQPAVYRPRPGADVDLQAARYQFAFANSQPTNRQASDPTRSAQPSVAQQPGAPLAPRQIRPALSRQQAANMAQAFRPYQQWQEGKIAKHIEARNRQALSSSQDARPAVNRDQAAAYNQQAFVSNQQQQQQQLPSAASYREQMIAARDRQQAYLSQQQANRSTPASAQSSNSHGQPTKLPPSQAQAFQSLQSQQHAAALLASRQAQHQAATQDRLYEPLAIAQVREVCLPVPQHLNNILN